MPVVAFAKLVIFWLFILRGVEPFVISVELATNLESAFVAFIIEFVLVVILATCESVYCFVDASFASVGAARLITFWLFRSRLAVGAVIPSNVVLFK